MRNQIFGRGVTKRRNQPVTKFRKMRNYFSEVMGGHTQPGFETKIFSNRI